ncbi:MAG: helix-hairpin-helix domain-containing protein, partial [Longimicrobiales bacterium]
MSERIDLNTALGEALTDLPGIGPGLARRIEEYRNSVGRFRTVRELAAVAGVTDRMVDRIQDRVRVDEPAVGDDDDPPPLIIQVVLKSGDYTGCVMRVDFTRKDDVTAGDGSVTSVLVPDQTSTEVPADGRFSVELPNRKNLEGKVSFSLISPDGETLGQKGFEAPSKLPPELVMEVKPKAYAETQPNLDPAAGKPTRLKGRVIDEDGRTQVARRQVVVWGAQAQDPGDADFRALFVTETDGNGYFGGPYPTGVFSAASGAVSVGEEPIRVPIHLQEDGSFPESVILVVSLDEIEAEEGRDCCKAGSVPRDPDTEDLARADGTFSDDPGAGRCVDFTKPDRTLEEFGYSYVVRTTEPAIKGLTLEEPRKVDIREITRFLASSVKETSDPELNARALMMVAQPQGGSQSEAGASTGGGEAARQPQALTAAKIDANIMHTLARDPDGFTLTRVAQAAQLTAHADLLRHLGKYLKLRPGRTRLSCRNPVDWDDEPTVYQACTVAHGHVLRFKQEWVADGYSMGNLLYSLPLAPGQKKQIAVVDWERRESALRTEAVEEEEAIQAFVSRDRDINEIVSGTVRESVRGGSKSSAGSFAGGLGIGAILGPVGGLLGIGGGTSSASSSAWQRSSRSTAASALNQLRDRTVQSASSLRSQRSTVVQTVRQGERVVATTESVANYNHCHAITIQYFEVLRHLLVRQRLADVQECLFVPLLMSRFTSEKALRWRDTLYTSVWNRRIRRGFDALDRMKANYVGSDFPDGTYADQLLEHAEGGLHLRFELARPKDKDDEFDPDTWSWLGHLFPFLSAGELYRTHLKNQALKDRIFQE